MLSVSDDFPWLAVDDYFQFPAPDSWDEEIVAVGGNLSPGLLISAYAQGIFPWFNEGEDILWWSLDPRFVLYFENLKISKSMKKILKKSKYRVTLDHDFPSVMRSCAGAVRKGEEGTWISNDMLKAYTELHRLGFAHSVEVWEDDELVGGLYGLSLGAAFFGESMFASRPNCSKIALIALTSYLEDRNFDFIDCQQPTAHLASLGACEIDRSRFLDELKQSLLTPSCRGDWSILFPDFPSSPLWNELCPAGVESPV